MDKYFSDGHVDVYIDEEGCKDITAMQRGQIYKRLKTHYHHMKKIELGPRSKAVHFGQPVIAVKEVKVWTG